MAEPSFYAWRQRLASERRGSKAAAFAAVRVVDDAGRPATGLLNGNQDSLVRVVDDAGRPAIRSQHSFAPCGNCVEIVLADGVRVRVPPGVDLRTLAGVLVVLQERAATSGESWDRHAGGGEELPAC